MALANACGKRGNEVVGEDEPAQLSGESSFGNGGHVIAFEGNHFEGPALSEFFGEGCEPAIREEGNLELVEAVDILRQT